MKTWLFKPFERIAGGPALVVGLVVILLTALLAWRAGLHTDGVLDLHFGPTVPWWNLILQGLINWLILAVLLLVTGRWLSHGNFRSIDLFGTQALARWPILLGVLWLSIPDIANQIETRTASLMAAIPDDPSQVIAPAEYLVDAMWLTVISLPLLAMLAWMIWLMYHGYALVTNLRGQRAVFSFVGALVVAEIVSKLLIWLLFTSTP
ncbi:MAG: hypothetical protein EA370_09400 [Wenzhouxiangella sp.]|nr:MAG: hypothetical protein EA370_09400 [Wenzhouxiangella sp.]